MVSPLLKILFSHHHYIIEEHEQAGDKSGRGGVPWGTASQRAGAKTAQVFCFACRNDDYFMGSYSIEDIPDCAYFDVLPFHFLPFFIFAAIPGGPPQTPQDPLSPRRQRGLFRRPPPGPQDVFVVACSKQPNSNKVEALLEWRQQLNMLPITINYLPEQSALTIEQLTRAHTTKSIPNENLAGLAEDVLAILVNIEWGQKGQTLKEF